MSCTGQLPGSFRFAQVDQTFSAQQEVNTKIDLLWVVDNSASMDVSQAKLRNGFTGFAKKYMQPTWDIRVAVITTDTYLANPVFNHYLGKTIPQTSGWKSPYILGRLSTFVNPDWNPNLVNLTSGSFDSGVLYGEVVPIWKNNYSRLLPGIHDGPIPAICSELMPYFLKGPTQCATRDDQSKYSGPSHCLNPNSSEGETSEVQCVNTIQNNTIHSGSAIISTQPPNGVVADTSWTNLLIQNFMINVSTGTAGHGSERGLASIMQLLDDNEKTETAFFRKNSLRGIIIVSDEEDQSMAIPSLSVAASSGDFTPFSNYKSGVDCPTKTTDGLTYAVSTCPDINLLTPVSDIKTKLDQFFLALDGSKTENSNYFVANILPIDARAIQTLQASRDLDDQAVGAPKTVAVDRGDRYIALADLVGNGSLNMNIAEEDYSPLLDQLGKTIIEKKSTFYLSRAPTGAEDMIVKVIHKDLSETQVPSEKFAIKGKSIQFLDQKFVLGLSSTDKISINYQPKTVF